MTIPEAFLAAALCLPPNHLAIVREFERFMKCSGYEYYIQFNEPPEAKKGWTAMPYLYKSYRVFVRRAG